MSGECCTPSHRTSWPGLTRPSMMPFREQTVSIPELRLIMDARVKPAHDAEYVARPCSK
jgi:hypothetical protein